MLNRKKKLALEELHSLLAGWATGVPGRARRFQALRADLDRQVTAALAHWWLPGLGDEELSALRQQIDRLGELAPLLAALILQAETDDKEVLDLRARAERDPDREIAGWLTDRCVDWQSALRRLGTHVEREPELEKDLAVLAKTGDLVRRHANALRRLEEAQQLLDRLGSRMETASLRADLPLLRQRLLAEGAGPAWLADMERAVGAVRAVVDVPPKKPPQTLQQVPELLAGARRWQRTLGIGEERNVLLLERYKLAEKDWEHLPEVEIQTLLRDAGEALANLRHAAGERCAAALARLAERSLQLADACGPSPDLEQELDRLRAAEAGDPDSYEEWMAQQTAVDHRLLSIAGANIGLLQARIDKLRHAFGLRLESLRREPLSSKAASELERLSLELAGLPDSMGDDLEPLFESLKTCGRIALALDALVARASGERDVLSAKRQHLLARHQALREEVSRCGIEVADLGPRILALSMADPRAPLDDLSHEAELLELELAAREKELAARCEAWIAERRRAVRGALELLHLLGRAPAEPSELTEEVHRPGLSRSAHAVAELRQWETAIAHQMGGAWQELAARGRKASIDLAALPASALRREERETATDLGLRLATVLEGTEAGCEERLRMLFEVLESGDTFLAKLSEEERSARDRAAALCLRLRDLNESGLDRLCPRDLVLRASALVHGVPDEPRYWGSVTGQLAAAEDLLKNLEDHARRRAAADLDRGISALESRLQAVHDPAFAGRARGLLDQAEAWGHDRIAPPLLRMRVRMLAPEAGGSET